jgi:hypothetical protein
VSVISGSTDHQAHVVTELIPRLAFCFSRLLLEIRRREQEKKTFGSRCQILLSTIFDMSSGKCLVRLDDAEGDVSDTKLLVLYCIFPNFLFWTTSALKPGR